MRVVQPASGRVSIVVGALAFVIAMLFLTAGSMEWVSRDWYVDEAHKIAESKAFGRLIAGRFHDPIWFQSPAAITNPPIPKYLSGFVILLSGAALPENDWTRWEKNPGVHLPLAGSEQVYLAARPAVRWLSLLVTATLAALLGWIAARYGGVLAATGAIAIFLAHPLPRTYATVAMHDPLLALVCFAALIPLSLAASTRPTPARLAGISVAAGVGAAVAFQTKLNGAIAAALTALVLVSIVPRGFRIRSFLLYCASATIVVLLVSPYYWASSPFPLPRTRFSDAPVLLRPLDRFALQLNLAERIVGRYGSRRLNGPGERLGYSVSRLLPQPLRYPVAAGLVLVLWFHRRHPPWLLLWAAAMIIGFALWIPLPWNRYLLPALPATALLASFGWTAALAEGLTLLQRRAAEPAAKSGIARIGRDKLA